MAHSWVTVNRGPTFTLTALLAFRPVRDPDHLIRLHPLVCEMLNADFDGDQVAILLPITEGAQREAGEHLSVAGHLARDAGLPQALLPPQETLWGLGSLSLTAQWAEEIARLAGVEVATAGGVVMRDALARAMQKVLELDGIAAVLQALERLTRRGFEVAKAWGASLNPFIGASLERPPTPVGDAPEAWDAYAETLVERVASRTDYADVDLGPQLLAVKGSGQGYTRSPG